MSLHTEPGTYPLDEAPVIYDPLRFSHPYREPEWPELMAGMNPHLVPKPWEVEERQPTATVRTVRYKYIPETKQGQDNLTGTLVPLRSRTAQANKTMREWSWDEQQYVGEFKVWLMGASDVGLPGGWYVCSGSNYRFYPGWDKADFEPGGPAYRVYSEK